MIYACGGGMGHLTRALSLARIAARHQIRTRIVCNSPFLEDFLSPRVKRLITLDPLIEILAIPSSQDRAAQIALIQSSVQQCRYQDVLIVDTFPRGLAGELINELPRLDCFKVFIHRDLNPEYVEQKQLEQAIALYDLMIVPGEDAPLQQLGGVRTSSWMICDSNELLSRTEARRVFQIPDNDSRPLITLIGSGTEDECVQTAHLARRLVQTLDVAVHVRVATLNSTALVAAKELGIAVWPLLLMHAGIDLLIGAGGYNTVHEARATERILLAIPQSRLYDRQHDRLSSDEACASTQLLISRTASCVADLAGNAQKPPAEFENGAIHAFQAIEVARKAR